MNRAVSNFRPGIKESEEELLAAAKLLLLESAIDGSDLREGKPVRVGVEISPALLSDSYLADAAERNESIRAAWRESRRQVLHGLALAIIAGGTTAISGGNPAALIPVARQLLAALTQAD